MFDAHVRFGRLRFVLELTWDEPEQDDLPPPLPLPHLAPLDPLEIDGEEMEDEQLGFRMR